MADTLNPLSQHAVSHSKTKDDATPRTHNQRGVKPFIVSEISMIRKTRSPQIEYENKLRPGTYKRRLSADDVIMGRYRYIPISLSRVKEKAVITRQKKLLSLAKKSGKPIPKFMLPPEAENKENVPEKRPTDRRSSREEPKEVVNDEIELLLPVIETESGEDNTDASQQRPSPREENDDGDDVFFDEKSRDDDEDSDDDLNEKVEEEEETDGFGEYVSYLVEQKREKRLNSDDFDTDLESTESEEEEEVDVLGREKPPKVNLTLENYLKACEKFLMRPNPTFVRQCGKSSVDMRYRMVAFRDAKPLAIALVADLKISFLDLSNNHLGPIGVTAIAEMMAVNVTIIELNLSNTCPESKGMEALAKSLGENNTLRRLYLENNNLIASDGNIVASLIENSESLLELHLASNNLGFEGTKQIAKVLSLNKGKLNVLNLSYNNIRTDSAAQLATALKKNTILRSLDISWNGFGVEGCRALSTALQVNSTLRDLNLTCNRLGIKSLGFLMKGLLKNKGLHCIRVGMNPLTTEGAKSLVSTITTCKTSALTELDLRGVPLDEEFFVLKDKLCQQKVIRVHYDDNVYLGTSDITRETDGTFLDNFSPVLVMFEFMKKDNLRVIDFFQFFDTRRRDKLSKTDLANGFNTLMIPFTQHHVDIIMKTLDNNKDGFLSLDEMVVGYTKNNKSVKQRQIKANRLKRKDEGLETLWLYLKKLIVKRKDENVKKNAAISQARRDSLLPPGGRRGSIMPGTDGRKGSVKPAADGGKAGTVADGGKASIAADGHRGSIGSDGRRGSLIPGAEGRRDSLLLGSDGKMLLPGTDIRRGGGPLVTEARRFSLLFVGGSDQGSSLMTPRRKLSPSTPEEARLLEERRRSTRIEEEVHLE